MIYYWYFIHCGLLKFWVYLLPDVLVIFVLGYLLGRRH